MPDPPNIPLPPIFRRTLEYLRKLTSEEFANFIEVLGNLSPACTATEVSDRFAAALPGGNPAIITGLLEFAISTRRLVSNLNENAETIAEAIVRAYAASTNQDRQVLQKELGGRVLAVLSSDFIALREKSIDLASEAAHRFRSVRSITDLRPVFAVDGSTDDIAGFVVVHTLKLEFHGNESESLYVVLDHDGVRAFSDILVRALEKEDRLARLLNESNIADLSLRADP